VNSANSSDPIRVVVVEDDSAMRKTIMSVLQNTAGYSVVGEFDQGQMAIRGLAACIPDLVLVDLGLPDIPGLEVIEQAKATCPECDVVVITTFGDEQSVYTALEAGADGYLLKGGTEEELRRDIKCLSEGGSPLSPAISRKVLSFFSVLSKNKKMARSGAQDAKTARLLTEREVDILDLISRGFSYDEAATQCSITRDTVHAHLKSIYRKLNVHSKTQAVFRARQKKIIP
jgi:DNA-binding NarL/FixJ family response regulator